MINVRLKSELIFGSVFNTFLANPNRISQKAVYQLSFHWFPQIFVAYKQKTNIKVCVNLQIILSGFPKSLLSTSKKNEVYVNLQIIFHFQASPNLRRVLPHSEQRGPRQGPKMVVKHPRGQHAHGLAPVRGQSPLCFLHDLPVHCLF